MRPVKVLGVCLPLAMGMFAAQSSKELPQDRSTLNQLEVHYRFHQTAITIHEPVVMLFIVHNGLQKPVTLTLGRQSRQYFQFSLTTPDGQTLQAGPLPEGGVTFGSGEATVTPGADYQQRLLLNQWFQFKSEGTYLVTARLTTEMNVSGNGNLPPQSGTAQFRITPRDPSRLRRVCAELARQVTTAANAEAAQEPALILSSVDDPVAVRYLAKVLSSRKLTQRFVVAGLERVGNDEAIKVLLAALHDKFGDIADLARQALRRLQDGIADPAFKERVKRALRPKRGG